MNKTNSRRLFLKYFFSGGVGLASVITGIESCQSKNNEPKKENAGAPSADPCSDYTNLEAKDVKARQQLGYVQKAPTASKQCGSCKLWLPPPEGQPCGKCQLFKGPVPATAYCTYWAPQS